MNNEYYKLRKEFDEKLEVVTEQLEKIDEGNKALLSLEAFSILDKSKIETNVYSKEDMGLSLVNLNEVYGFLNLSSTALEELDLSFEELDGKRESLMERIKKAISDANSELIDSLTETAPIFYLLKKYKTETLQNLKNELLNSSLQIENDQRLSATLRKDLGIFNLFEFDINKKDDLINWINLPHELLINKKLLEEGLDLSFDVLVVSRSNEIQVKPHKTSLELFDRIRDRSVRKWLSSGSKYAFMNKTIGDNLKILSLIQDSDVTDVRFDYFRTGSLTSNFNGYSKKDMLDILDVAIDLKEKGIELGKFMKKSFWTNEWKNIKSSIMTGLMVGVLNIFASKRVLRHMFLANSFRTAMLHIYVTQMKSHLDSGELIESIVLENTKRK